jgi:hypothetical protein
VTRRIILCEGPDDLNALRAIAQHQRWASAVRGPTAAAGQERQVVLTAGSYRIEIKAPSRAQGSAGEGKTALARTTAETLHNLAPQIGPPDESHVSLVAVAFDPDGDTVESFHAAVAGAIQAHAPAWTLTGAAGTWRAKRDAGEEVDVRAVHWRAPGGVLDGLPDHANLERLLCAVAARAYPGDLADVDRWLREMADRRRAAGRKPAGWKAAIHVWLAAVYEKVDQENAATRFLSQQDECKPHVAAVLTEAGLLDELRALLADV